MKTPKRFLYKNITLLYYSKGPNVAGERERERERETDKKDSDCYIDTISS